MTTPASALAPAWLQVPEDINAINPVMFPAGVSRNDTGAMTIHGITMAELAEEFGSPLLVIDEDDFRSRARNFLTSFNQAFADLCGGVDVYFAGKSMLSIAIARWVAEEGLRLDTASGGELAVALRAGTNPAHIGLHGNNKSDAELIRALDTGVGRIVVDSLDELARLETIAEEKGVKAPVMLRLTPGVHASTHDFIATAHEDQKFGLSMVGPENDFVGSVAEEAVLAAAGSASITFLGLHSHIGSQIFESEGFEEAARRMLEFIAHLKNTHQITVDELDIGGGYGIAYTPADTPAEPRDIAEKLAAAISAAVADLGIQCPRISIEPGRSIAGPSGITIYSVGVIKDVTVDATETSDGQFHTRRYVAVDGGMSDNPRPVLYDADYTAVLATRTSQAPAVLSRVVGKHCESGDIVVRDGYLPSDVVRNDLLVVPATGAYGHVMSSNYNMLTRPAVVAVSSTGARLIIRRETEDDLFARDLG